MTQCYKIGRKQAMTELHAPPQDLSAEKVVIGSIMMDDTLLDTVDTLNSNCFYSEKHRMIFEAIQYCRKNREPVDVISLANRLEQNGELDKIGGKEELMDLVENSLTVSRIEHHATRLKNLKTARSVLAECQKTAQLILCGDIAAEEALEYHDKKIQGLRTIDAGKTMQSMAEMIPEMFEQIETASRQEGSLGLSTGFVDIDRLTTGFHPGELVIIAGRPGRGKTAFALQIALHNAMLDIPVPSIVFSLEMSRASIAMRIASTVSEVEVRRMRGGMTTKAELERLKENAAPMHKAPLWIDDDTRPTVQQIAARSRTIKRKYGCLGCVIVDYIGLMKEPGRHESRHREISEISNGLKSIAKDLECPVIALNQLGRECETREPNLSDLKDSGSLEQDADAVIFIHWPWRNDKTKNRNEMEIMIGKQRNGPIGTVLLTWEPEFTRFTNHKKEDEEEISKWFDN